MSDSSSTTGTTLVAILQVAGMMVFGYEFARSWLSEAKALEEVARRGREQSK